MEAASAKILLADLIPTAEATDLQETLFVRTTMPTKILLLIHAITPEQT
jgi:hypothetical protein